MNNQDTLASSHGVEQEALKERLNGRCRIWITQRFQVFLGFRREMGSVEDAFDLPQTLSRIVKLGIPCDVFLFYHRYNHVMILATGISCVPLKTLPKTTHSANTMAAFQKSRNAQKRR